MLSMPSGGEGGAAGEGRKLDGDEMVQDPECKVYVPLARAVSRKVGGETLYFCSEDCAKKHVKKRKIGD